MEIENTIQSEMTQIQKNTPYALTDKWILAKKLRITKMRFTDHMKFKKKENQSVDTLIFLRRGIKIPREDIQRQSMEQRLKERPSRDCSPLGSIPYTFTKLPLSAC